MQKEVVDLRLRLKIQSNSDENSLTDEELVKKAITRWAKFFGIFYFLGVTVDDFVKVRPDFKHDDLSRYEEGNACLGTAAELYAVVPGNFMNYLVKFESLAGQVREIPHHGNSHANFSYSL